MLRVILFLVFVFPLSVQAGTYDRTNMVLGSDNRWRTTSVVTIRERHRCTMPSTRTDGQSFLPAGVRAVEWKAVNNSTGSVYSFFSEGCPAILDLIPGTYTLQSRLHLTTDSYNVSAWQTLSNSMVVPLP